MYDRLHVLCTMYDRLHLGDRARRIRSPDDQPHFKVHVLHAITDTPPADGECFLLHKTGDCVGQGLCLLPR